MSDSEPDTSRTVVQTYVPAYQRELWDRHADQLGMNRSEFVRTMVQAGRRGFGAEPSEDTSSEPEDVPLEEHIRDELAAGARSWEELLSAVTGDIESRLEVCLEELQEANAVRYSGREGGYVLVDEHE